jgi:hypothetical protein
MASENRLHHYIGTYTPIMIYGPHAEIDFTVFMARWLAIHGLNPKLCVLFAAIIYFLLQNSCRVELSLAA